MVWPIHSETFDYQHISAIARHHFEWRSILFASPLRWATESSRLTFVKRFNKSSASFSFLSVVALTSTSSYNFAYLQICVVSGRCARLYCCLFLSPTFSLFLSLAFSLCVSLYFCSTLSCIPTRSSYAMHIYSSTFFCSSPSRSLCARGRSRDERPHFVTRKCCGSYPCLHLLIINMRKSIVNVLPLLITAALARTWGEMCSTPYDRICCISGTVSLSTPIETCVSLRTHAPVCPTADSRLPGRGAASDARCLSCFAGEGAVRRLAALTGVVLRATTASAPHTASDTVFGKMNTSLVVIDQDS